MRITFKDTKSTVLYNLTFALCVLFIRARLYLKLLQPLGYLQTQLSPSPTPLCRSGCDVTLWYTLADAPPQRGTCVTRFSWHDFLKGFTDTYLQGKVEPDINDYGVTFIKVLPGNKGVDTFCHCT